MSGLLNLNTIETVDNSNLRPRFNGFTAIQENSWDLIHQFLLEEENLSNLLDRLDAVYHEA